MIYYVDMGTTNIRIYDYAKQECIYSGGEGVKHFHGSAGFDEEKFAIFIEEKLESISSHIFISGMIGSSLGLIETEYIDIEKLKSLKISDLSKVEINKNKIYVFPGVSIDSDIMRGEEVELLGILRNHELSNYEKILLPGTHSKLVAIKDGEISSFKTLFTGELISLIINSSTLFTNLQSSLLDVKVENLTVIKGSLIENLFKCRSTQILAEKSEIEALEYLLSLIYNEETSLLTPEKTLIVCDENRKRIYDRYGSYEYETNIMSMEGFKYFYENNTDYFSTI